MARKAEDMKQLWWEVAPLMLQASYTYGCMYIIVFGIIIYKAVKYHARSMIQCQLIQLYKF